MSDIAIFVFGLVVTAFVASAVGLLLWGAAQERDINRPERMGE